MKPSAARPHAWDDSTLSRTGPPKTWYSIHLHALKISGSFTPECADEMKEITSMKDSILHETTKKQCPFNGFSISHLRFHWFNPQPLNQWSYHSPASGWKDQSPASCRRSCRYLQGGIHWWPWESFRFAPTTAQNSYGFVGNLYILGTMGCGCLIFSHSKMDINRIEPTAEACNREGSRIGLDWANNGHTELRSSPKNMDLHYGTARILKNR